MHGGGALIVPKLDEEGAGRAPTTLDRVAYDAASDGFGELADVLGDARAVGVEEDHLTFARVHRLQELGREPRRRARSCSSPARPRTRTSWRRSAAPAA